MLIRKLSIVISIIFRKMLSLETKFTGVLAFWTTYYYNYIKYICLSLFIKYSVLYSYIDIFSILFIETDAIRKTYTTYSNIPRKTMQNKNLRSECKKIVPIATPLKRIVFEKNVKLKIWRHIQSTENKLYWIAWNC